MSQIVSLPPRNPQQPNDTKRNDSNAGPPGQGTSSSSDDEDYRTPASDERDSFRSRVKQGTILASVMKQSQWRVRTSPNSRRADYAKMCSLCLRECRAEPTTGDGNDLITPCLCSGYRSRHHKRCIEEWIEQTGALGCPFCQVRYEFSKRKKSFTSYIKELELEEDLLSNLGLFAFAVYLFLVGVSICYKFIFATSECEPEARATSVGADAASIKFRDRHDHANRCRSASPLEQTHSWPSSALFCLICTGTVILFISTVSLCSRVIIKHCIRYFLWSKTNFRVSVEPYRLVV